MQEHLMKRYGRAPTFVLQQATSKKPKQSVIECVLRHADNGVMFVAVSLCKFQKFKNLTWLFTRWEEKTESNHQKSMRIFLPQSPSQ
ncbi:hypothetical protein AKJ16_DCAP27533, partial [Drosera capensis]